MTSDNSSKNSPNKRMILPSLIVFDLDDCLWTPEMHELSGMPEIPIHGDLGNGQTGVVGLQVMRGRDTVTLYEGARRVLYELATNPIYNGVLLATASSSLEPSYSHACLNGIEILPHLTMADMMSSNQIGRSGRLSPNKTSHFSEIHNELGIPYEEMLFFDDCNWGDHCGRVTQELGVVSWRTPAGLQWKDFQGGLEKYHQHHHYQIKQKQNND
mmetsp:Transcript_13017/g.23379  ORF Transcript_13017/g.23379 Transcript_13017/m.23379 type:complete len:214 (+) Transcript_13017:69-710(+)